MAGGTPIYYVGCDIGGTFTDLVLYDSSSGEIVITKVVTDPGDPSEGVINGARALKSRVHDYLSATREFIHATTLVANAVVERRGSKTALLATRGFRDVLELRRHVRIKNTEMWNDPPEPLVPRHLRLPVTERAYADGRILAPVDEDEVRRNVEYFLEQGIESVAVAFLHSYANGTNEQCVGRIIRELAPDMAVSLSSQVLPEYQEYERTATTVVNAYVKPITQGYLRRLEGRLADEGFQSKLFVTLSNGGLASLETASEFPVRAIESGPVAGAVAAQLFARLSGLDEVLSLDMGGTTAKTCLIKSGALPLTSELEVARSERLQRGSGYPVAIPSVDLIEIGAGGGSLARVNDLGLVQVGPESAGADPGPICYGFGGEDTTVTDADLVLGYLDPDYFLGGEMKLDIDSAARGLQKRLAEPLGRELLDVAWTVHQVVNENMAAAVKMHVIERGGDPARSSLVAFGGAGPVHAYDVAHKLGIQKVLVPPLAGVTSALGLLAAPPAFDMSRTYKVPFQRLDFAALQAGFQEMEREVEGLLRGVDPDGPAQFSRSVDVCYIGQGYQVPIELPEGDLTTMNRETLWDRFAKEYEAKYGYFYDDIPAQVVNLRVRGSIAGRELVLKTLPRKASSNVSEALKGERPAYSVSKGGMVPHLVYDRYRLGPGMSIRGPAIIEEKESTTVVAEGGSVEVDDYGTLVISVGQAGTGAAKPDSLNLDMIWPRLISIADEMATTQIRTAFSHDVIEVHDMSTGICDPRGYLVAQTNLGATGHTGTMPPLVKNILQKVPRECMHPGDAYITNDPWVQSGHTADIFVVTPAFLGPRLIGFAVTSIHHLDIGGRAGSGLTEEVYEEGLILPILPLMREGKPNEELFSIIRRNVRFSERVIGDLRSQVATGYVGAQRLAQLLEEQDLSSIEGVADEIIARSETVMRQGIGALRDGTYRSRFALDMADQSGNPLQLCLALTVRGDELYADFTGTSPQVRRPINDPLNHVRAFMVEAIKMICAPHAPNNEGSHRPIFTYAPEGCLLNPTYPAPVFWRIVGTLSSDLALAALSQAAPELVPAGTGSLPIFQFYISGLRRSGQPFSLHQHAFGGMGGRPGRDGLASVSFPYSVREVSTEGSEMETPLLYEKREIPCDSGGAGQWRGGSGEELVIRALPDGDVGPEKLIVFSGAGGRFTEPPHGISGGRPGARAEILVDGVPQDPATLGNSPEVHLRSDQVLTIRLAGGGGYGDPRKRNPRLIQADLDNGYISKETAIRDYGYDPDSI